MSEVEIVTTLAPVEILVDRNGLSQSAVDRHVAAKHTRTALGADIIGAAPTAGRLVEGGAGGVLQHAAIAETVTGAVLTLSATLAGNRTWTVPDRADTFVGLAAQTFTGVQTFAAGSAAAPSVAMVDSGLGFWRVSSGVAGFSAGGVERMRLSASGIVTTQVAAGVVGIANPFAFGNLAAVAADGSGAVVSAVTHGNGSTVTGNISGVCAQGTAAVPAATAAADEYRNRFVGYDGSAYQVGGFLGVLAGSLWSGSNRETYARMVLCPSGSTSIAEYMRWFSDGGVQIGGTYGTSPGAGGLKTGGAVIVKKTAIVSAAATTAIAVTDHFVVVTGSTTHTLTLPAAVDGKQLFLKNRSTGTVTVNRAGADTIDGGTTFNLTAGQGTTLVCNGTDWCRASNA